jgi:DNA mismatch endonuclease (patch repair protein)
MESMDKFSPKKRSEIMAKIGPKDTKPEMIVRKLVHGMGYRYRLHNKTLPGTPDLTLRSRKKIIFVHGCFWHRHRCKRGTIPATRKKFWTDKLEGNRQRDRQNIRKLRRDGWQVMVVWECWCKDPDSLTEKLRNFLSS